MRWLCVGMTLVALAGCSKAPDNGAAGDTVSNASSLAFSYRYELRLPSQRIADMQEAQAQACERLGPQCRITGMAYHVDSAGNASASLDMAVASSLARIFGRDGVKRVEASGGALTGAEILGTDTAPAIQGADASLDDTAADRATLDRRLALPGLSPTERSELLARRAELDRQRRDSLNAVATTRASALTTPISFNYAAGSGVGLQARLAEAANVAYASFTWTITTLLSLVAYLGPPLLLLLGLVLLWHRLGRRWWARLFPTTPDA